MVVATELAAVTVPVTGSGPVIVAGARARAGRVALGAVPACRACDADAVIETGIDIHYLAAQRSFVELARTLTEAEWTTPVACTPGWTARDVLSHVSGIPDDALAGRLDGVATAPWTASQVDRNREHSVEDLLARWDEQAPLFAEAIAGMGERRPPIDCHTHEHDVRHALGRPGNRDSGVVRAASAWLVREFGLPLTVHLHDGRVLHSEAEGVGAAGEGVELTGVSGFELFRSRLGRRTPAQVAAYDWSGPADRRAAVLEAWFAFGPSETDIVE